jgi:hypothetical protein
VRTLLVLLTAAVLAAAAPPSTEEQRAKDAIRDLGMLLQQLLGEEIKRGGVEGAVQMCSENAQLVTTEFAKERGLEIRRVSTSYRNASNRPDEYESRILAAWAKSGKPATHVERVTENGRQWLRMMEPIHLQAMCVNCHGTAAQLTDEVKAVLAERYPRDKATGFKPGDLRGAFSVLVLQAP